MKTAIAALLIFEIIVGVWSICAFTPDDATKKCAEPQRYSSDVIFRHYYSGYSTEESPSFHKFVDCVWKEWGFMDNNFVINYNAIKSTKIQPLLITGICDDIPKERTENPFVSAVEECQRGAPADVRAETIRHCIAEHYKANLKK